MSVSEPTWFEIVEGEELFQGDILFKCPIVKVDYPDEQLSLNRPELNASIEYYDAVVLSQSCDLVNDKIENMLLTEVVSWEEILKNEIEQGNNFIKSEKFRKNLVNGHVPNLSLLHRFDGSPRLSWSVVNFHNLFVVPKSVMKLMAKKAGKRLRLKSPYREHLSQASARFFMRVGLPHDAPTFIKEGKI